LYNFARSKIKKMKYYLFVISVCLAGMLKGQENPQIQRERVKMSGQVMLMSATNSNLTGGYYSLAPAIRGQVTASYRNFAFTAMRNSDLLNPESAANLTVLAPAYARTFGAFTMTFSAETYLFDHRRDLDLISPSFTLSRKGVVNVEALVLYGASFEGKDVFSQRLSISKDYAGFTFKLTGWNVYWGTHRTACAAEISTKLTDHFRFTVIGNLNYIYDDDKTQKFGVVRIGYAF
jgi:hypothetical protein